MAKAVLVDEIVGLGLATVMARKDVNPLTIGSALGLEIVDGPVCSNGHRLTLLGTGPGAWLARTEHPAKGWVTALRDRLAQLASVSDQSAAFVVFRLSGPHARKVLQRGAPLDFHPACFAPGSVATTVIAHIGVIIHQIDDAPTYDIALFRSFAASFRDWLDTSLKGLPV